MAMAHQNTAINVDNSQKVNLFQLLQLLTSQIQRLLWHSHAYGTVFGVLILSLGSLIFLGIHWTYRKLFFTPSVVETNEWDMKSSN
ncbi:hypothetical protein [Trichormus variabilis]|uniref:Uncharacterized protein n=2 Tax=Anabaena variabilis TaxID=264691 RepID=A0A3S1CAQ2_ANAVA|nr:hypothetical protein [Trichormus variabilis]MBD2627358.1 hypothetical protein [Trichormus variabilis FACHB-164]RUS99845.1 hypothetical protein DSM107003_04290 [Trichormus variabilis SAG 1403-4b]